MIGGARLRCERAFEAGQGGGDGGGARRDVALEETMQRLLPPEFGVRAPCGWELVRVQMFLLPGAAFARLVGGGWFRAG